MPTPITSKAEMFRRLQAGLLGHTLPAAETREGAERLLAMGGLFGLRFRHTGAKTMYNLAPDAVRAALDDLPDGTYSLAPMLSDPHRVCYAHLLDDRGWFLHYSTDKKPCKLLPSVDGCRERWLAHTAARRYLQEVCDDIGWATLTDLVESYPAHVIEFSVMSGSRYAYGSTNTIIWEVRSTCGAYEADTWNLTQFWA